MKSNLRILLLLCIACIIAGCGNKSKNEPEETIMEETVETVESDDAESIAEKEVEDEKEGVSETDSLLETETVNCPEILSLRQNRYVRHEWEDDVLLVRCEHSNVTLEDEQYPQLGQTLSETATMMNRSMEYEADNILSFMQEMGRVDFEDFETQVSTSETQVRRADSVAISLLADSYAYYGFIDGVRGMIGSTYDTQTGEMLMLSDIIIDMEPIPAIVEKELNSHIWAGEFYSEEIVEEYFKNTPEDGLNWTLDYNGVTFYFGDGDLAEPGNGRLTATVAFAEYPELFHEKYMLVPEAYMVELPLDNSFFTDLDEDGTLEELNFTGFCGDTENVYTDLGIYTDTDGYYHYEECPAYGFHPYYVKTADGNHYLYVFCEESEQQNRQMYLIVYKVNKGLIAKVGEMNVAPKYISEDMFILPLDPNKLQLENSYEEVSEADEYYVGESGMPVKR